MTSDDSPGKTSTEKLTSALEDAETGSTVVFDEANGQIGERREFAKALEEARKMGGAVAGRTTSADQPEATSELPDNPLRELDGTRPRIETQGEQLDRIERKLDQLLEELDDDE